MNRHTVLLVDDEKVIREGCRRAFAASGFRVVTATNGREALDAMSHERIDAILCDLKMPVMGAMGVLAQVTERYPEVPLIIITGQGTIANALECMRHGAYDFVTKPFESQVLVGKVKQLLFAKSMEGSSVGPAAKLAAGAVTVRISPAATEEAEEAPASPLTPSKTAMIVLRSSA